MTQIRLAILDDYALVRKGFCIMLNNISGFNVLLETDNQEKITALIKTNCPDILLLDISMPDTNGLDLVPKFLNLNKDLKIIMLTTHNEGECIADAITNGAFAYILKNTEPDKFEATVRTVKKGRKYFDPFISESLIKNISEPKEIRCFVY